MNDLLANWDEIAESFQSGGLLVGNGGSIAVCRRFAYASLLDEAHLNPEHRGLFGALGTSNFELVLRSLAYAKLACRSLGTDDSVVEEAYDSIRNALVDALGKVHWRQHEDSRSPVILGAIGDFLKSFDSVFSTNYDLVLYWAMANMGWKHYVDFFWKGEFSESEMHRFAKRRATQVHWLHGALHLWGTVTGTEGKLRADNTNLLERAGKLGRDDRVPLFVAEGTSEDKLRVIRGSRYLSFVYDALANFSGPLVLYGLSLGEQDSHIVQAIEQPHDRPLAVSVHRPTTPNVIKHKANLIAKISNPKRLFWFDAKTCPLDPTYSVPPLDDV